MGQDELKKLNYKDKVVLILDERLAGQSSKSSKGLSYKIFVIQKLGATAVFTVINPVKEVMLTNGLEIFDSSPVGRMKTIYDSQKSWYTMANVKSTFPIAKSPIQTPQAEISHEIATDILGVSKAEIAEMFNMIKQGKQINSKDVADVRVRFDVEIDSFETNTRNVIGVVEGSDADLKDEYILICAHYDHLGVRNGDIFPGANDNGTGIVALMEIADALLKEIPKRSTIIAWFTGEERGMQGSNYFINNCPVPIEKISACLNLDMLGRNSIDSMFLIGSDLLSSELDGAIKKVNEQFDINFGLDYKYSNLDHPQRVYFRSDHFPFMRFGIPSVWFFAGFTLDYHTQRDVVDLIDYDKLCRATRLVYLTAYEIGNKKEILKLDVNRTVTSRGKHNVTNITLF